jgi:hypothetical protein
VIGNATEHIKPKVAAAMRARKEVVAEDDDDADDGGAAEGNGKKDKKKKKGKAAQKEGTEGLVQRELFAYEEEERMPAYGTADNFADYNELVLQYGYLTLFAVAFPLVAALVKTREQICATFVSKIIVLPRQARDKNSTRENVL